MKVSIVIPIYEMENGIEFLMRNLRSVENQTFEDYNVIVSDNSDNEIFEKLLLGIPNLIYYRNPNKGMAQNTNYAIDKARGELVKILFQDDYFYHEYALQDMVKHFTPKFTWLATGCIHTFNGQDYISPHKPYYSESENTIGSPSVLMFRNDILERFDTRFKWVLDLDFYKQLHRRYGRPKILDSINIAIGLHQGQETNKLSEETKRKDFDLLKQKYA